MRPARHAPPLGFHFLDRNVHAQFTQARDEAQVTLAPRTLQVQQPRTKLRRRRLIHKVPEQMNGASMKTGGDLDAANQIQARGARQWGRAIVAGQRIVIRNRQRFQATRNSRFHQLRGLIGPVGLVSMCVKIDQKEISPRLSSLAQTRSALSSGVSLAECTTTSGSSGGS